jgi:hypothetical protein
VFQPFSTPDSQSSVWPSAANRGTPPSALSNKPRARPTATQGVPSITANRGAPPSNPSHNPRVRPTDGPSVPSSAPSGRGKQRGSNYVPLRHVVRSDPPSTADRGTPPSIANRGTPPSTPSRNYRTRPIDGPSAPSSAPRPKKLSH